MKMRSRHLGFSLIEILVVFILLSLIMGLLSQTFSVFMKAYFQINALEKDLFEEEIYSTWFRESVSSAVPFRDKSLGFYGDEKNIRFATADSLSGPQGEIKVATWTIDSFSGVANLLYGEKGATSLVLGEWKDSEANFAFRGDSLDWRSTWPPENASPGLLPSRVKINLSGEREREIFAGIVTRKTPRYDYRDLL